MPGRLAVVPLLLVPFLAACDHPTGVGSELVDAGGGLPVEVVLTPTEMAIASEPDVTGGSESTQRMLVGTTRDPDLGLIEATGHIDFALPVAQRSDAFLQGPVTSATLLLARVYGYGDLESSVGVQVHDIAAEWAATGAKADTVFAVADMAGEADFVAGSTVLEVPLSSEWVARWDAALRSQTFAADFHGFRVRPRSGDAIAGFQQIASSIRAVAAGDTVYYPAVRTHTNMRYEPSLSLSDGRVLLQDSRGAGTVLRFDLDDDALSAAAIARIQIEVPFDTSLTSSAPTGYTRPLINTVELYAVAVDPPGRLSIAVGTVDDGVLRFETDDLTGVISRYLDGDSPLDHFELSPDPDVTSLNVLLVGRPIAEGPGARAVLTVIPFE